MFEDRDSKLIQQLVSYYGSRNDWNAEHLEHYHFYLMLMAYQINERLYDMAIIEQRAPYEKLNACLRLARKLSDELDESIIMSKEEACVHEATHDDLDAKMYLLDLLLKNISKKLYIENRRFSALENSEEQELLIAKFASKVRSRKPLFEFLDYLTIKLGSINKALTYVDDSPVIKSPKLETMKREYRKYRNDLDE